MKSGVSPHGHFQFNSVSNTQGFGHAGGLSQALGVAVLRFFENATGIQGVSGINVS